MPSRPITAEVCRVLDRLRFDALPAPVVDGAKQVMLDGIENLESSQVSELMACIG